jgi:long-chain acyl-CoA synthetase
VVLATELSEASGHLTPKLSIKRNVILADFADVIDGIYSRNPSTQGISLAH